VLNGIAEPLPLLFVSDEAVPIHHLVTKGLIY
jgi:hypothetical protein